MNKNNIELINQKLIRDNLALERTLEPYAMQDCANWLDCLDELASIANLTNE